MGASETFTLNIKALFDASDVRVKVGDIQKAFNNLKLPDSLKTNLQNSFSKVEKALTDFEAKAARGVKTKADANGLTRSMDNIITEFTKLSGVVDKVKSEINSSTDLSKIIKLDDATLEKLRNIKKEITDLQKKIDTINASKITELQTTLSKLTSKKASEYGKEAFQLFNEGDIDGAIKKLDEVIEKYTKLSGGDAKGGRFSGIIASFNQLKQSMVDAKTEAAPLTEEIGRKTQQMADETTSAMEREVNAVNSADTSIKRYGAGVSAAKGSVTGFINEQQRMNTELDQVKSRIKYLLGLNNAFNLIRRGIRSAFNTVKELDKAMTETAVVTDMTVSDMWAKLPEYTKRANELGVKTLEAYQAATLYYQQGLNDTQVSELSVETLRMARIAGLEAAEATDRMTNALRGFNMELNAVNAQKVDDVYSKLAAISASNVDEISTAMTKVASLAHNANMDFETTAAFLAQIIETTRESAETAGTALKTVVARFSEVKKLVNEDQLKGQDEEGQVIDVNKVSAALRTAGIDLNKYFLGEVGLDDIFMELAEKWDSLTSVQQRYIATQAAGSRQQSRFIAMMQDYARTQELVTAAYNSNGASAAQFEKTQDSLQSKLARLKNAWDEFLMGITNSSFIKTVVDLLTLLLNIVNKLTSAFSFLGDTVGGFISSLLKLSTAVLAFKGLRTLFKTNGVVSKLFTKFRKSPVGGFLFGKEDTEAAKAAGRELAKGGAEGGAAMAAGGAKASTEEAAGGEVGGTAMEAGGDAGGAAAAAGGKIGGAALEAGGKGSLVRGFLSPSSGKGKTLLRSQNMGGTVVVPGKSTGAGEAAGTAAKAGLGVFTKFAIAAVVAGLLTYGIYKLWKKFNPSLEERIKKAEENAKIASEATNRTKQRETELKGIQDEYAEKDEAVQKAATIDQRNKAIKDRNDYITSLLEQNAAYAKYVQTTFENGEIVLTLDSDALAAAVNQIAEAAVRVRAYEYISQAEVAQLRSQWFLKQAYGSDSTALFNGINWEESARTGKITPRQYTREQYQEIYNIVGSPEKIDRLYAQYVTNLEKYQQQQQLSQNYMEQAAASLIAPEKLSDSQAEIISKYLGKTYDPNKIYTEYLQQLTSPVEVVFNKYALASEEELRDAYFNFYGTEAPEDIEEDDLRKLVQEAERTEQVLGAQVDRLTILLTGKNGNIYEDILGAAVGETNIENIDLSGIDLDRVSLSKIFGIDEYDKYLSDLEKAMGLEEGALRKLIIEQLRLAQQIQRTTKANIYKNAFKLGTHLDETQTRYVEGLAPEQAVQLEKITSKASGLLNAEQYQELFNSLMLRPEDWDQVQEFLNNINLDKPINAFLQLQEAAGSANKEIRLLSAEILETNKEALSPEALLLDFTESDSYTELIESLGKLKDANDEFTSSNILELAEANEKLNNLLKTGVITSKALAVALNGIKNGTIATTELNSRLIAALNAMDDLDGAAKKTIEDLNSFEPGYDENDVVEFITKAYDFSKEQLEKGAYGNNQMQNYMEYIFGFFDYKPEMGPYRDAYRNWLQNNLQWLENNKENMRSAWVDLVATAPEEGFKEGVRVWEEGGEILIDSAGHTTDELIQILAEGSGLTEQQIRMMITDYKNNSDDFAHVLEEEDLNRALDKWVSELPDTVERGRFYLEEELEVLAKLLGEDPKKLQKLLEERYSGIEGYSLGEGKTEDITNILDQAGYSYLTDIPSPFGFEFEFLDYDKLKASMDKAGLSQYFGKTLDDMAKQYNGFVATIDGEPVKIEIQPGETAEEAYQRMVEKVSQQHFAQILADAISESFKTGFETEQIELKIEDTEVKSELEIIWDYIQNISGQHIVSFKSNPFSGFSGRTGLFTKAFAKGTDSNKSKSGTALTGEEAPEIVWNKNRGYAYITGINGPQFQNLKPGDQVFNGKQTEAILRNSFNQKEIFGSHSTDVGPLKDFVNSISHGYGAGIGTGGSGNNNNNNKDDTDWKNELDWLYDLMEDIAEEERKQTLIQSEYDLSLKDLTKTGKDLYELTKQELSSLQTQLNAQTFAYEKRLQQMNELQQQVNEKEFDQYIQWNPNDKTLEINWDKIEAITDKDTYDQINDFISKMEKVQDQMDDAEKSIWDIKKQIQEIQTRYLQKYLDFQQKVLDAVVKNYQDNIDKLNSLNDVIKDGNNSILNSIQKEIDLQRQIRDNTKTESEIHDMEARLAYLLRDTTNANQQEIQELQKKLKESRENYADTLIDQGIKKLQDNNKDAAEQREQQIKLLEAQLEYWKETGALWAEVAELIATGFTSQGSIIEGSALWEFLKNADSWNGLSEAQKKNWANELILEANEVGAHLIQLSGGIEVDTEKVVNSIADINGILTQDIEVQKEQVRAILEAIGSLGGTPAHSYTSGEIDNINENVQGADEKLGNISSDTSKINNQITKIDANGNNILSQSQITNENLKGVKSNVTSMLSEFTGYDQKSTRHYQDVQETTKKMYYLLESVDDILHNSSKSTILSDSENILNPQVSDKFLTLTELPNSALDQNAATNNFGNNVYIELTMNVGEIGSDYDVDRLVDRVKEDIYDTSSYRNVNAVSFLR